MKLPEADKVAGEFFAEIDQFCSRVEIGGSVRRRRPEVKDIEIICEPWVSKLRKTESLVEEYEDVNLLHERLTFLRKTGVVKSNRISKDGRAAPFSERYYRLTYFPYFAPNEGYPVDLFCVLKDRDWGVIYTIRTGSKDFSQYLMSKALAMGLKVDEGRLWSNWNQSSEPVKIPCPEEIDFLTALGLPFIPPEERDEYARVPTIQQGVLSETQGGNQTTLKGKLSEEQGDKTAKRKGLGAEES